MLTSTQAKTHLGRASRSDVVYDGLRGACFTKSGFGVGPDARKIVSYGEVTVPAILATIIAPTQPVPIIRVFRTNPETKERELVPIRWGLIPSWADDPAIGNRLINARAETVSTKP